MYAIKQSIVFSIRNPKIGDKENVKSKYVLRYCSQMEITSSLNEAHR